MSFHTAVGQRFGISKDETDKLISLEKKHFEYREWLALKYAQDRVFCGQEPEGEYMPDFLRLYTDKERAYILKFIRTQEFVNYWMNTFSKKPWRENLEGQSCPIGIKKQ